MSNQAVTARFDNNTENLSESIVYVWMDTSTTFEDASDSRTKRLVSVTVYCEGAAAGEQMTLDLPDRVNMVDGMDLGCDGRGIVTSSFNGPDHATRITGVNVAAVWSHIAQLGGGFRMNFGGYHYAE